MQYFFLNKHYPKMNKKKYALGSDFQMVFKTNDKKRTQKKVITETEIQTQLFKKLRRKIRNKIWIKFLN